MSNLNRSLGQRARWFKEELAQMAEAARVRVDEILGVRASAKVYYIWDGANLAYETLQERERRGQNRGWE